MQFAFYKYHGTGNDFVFIDDREERFPVATKVIARICHRRFGIGADGLILLQNHSGSDFKMVYFNADGNQSTMCGNGGRCMVKFAQDLGLIDDSAHFMAIDGLHEATVSATGLVRLKMIDTPKPVASFGHWFVDTGSPHHVQLVKQVDAVDVLHEGRAIRQRYGHAGSNVNFVEVKDNSLQVRTYERGVEDETYSCGTGVTASAIVAVHNQWVDGSEVAINTPGGQLSVRVEQTKNGFENVWLTGPATFVFQGECIVE